MTRLIRSSFVIARRDFSATVFSKAFLFFLIGPLFPLLLGGVFGGIGARVASGVEQPAVAVVATDAEYARIAESRERLARALPQQGVVRLVQVDPQPGDAGAQIGRLLERQEPAVLAVLVRPFTAPSLTGAVNQDGLTAGQLQIILDDARDARRAATPQVAVTKVERSAGQLSSRRALTGQAGQLLLFFLTILLAGMILSQLIEEKSNKIIEVLAAAVPIDAIFLGKLFAMLATSVLGITVWTLAGAGAISAFVDGGIASLAAPAVGWPAFILLGVIYFATNYLLLGSVFLSIGAQASTVREVQTLSMPVTMAQVAIFAFAALTQDAPGSPMGIAAAVFPLSSPLVMLARAATVSDLWMHLAAIAWQTLWVVVILHFGAKLFRRSVLKSGPTRRRSWFRPNKV